MPVYFRYFAQVRYTGLDKMANFTLDPKTIAAQQALSNKYGIPTFNASGNISTVPSSGVLSSLAQTVGVGMFTKETPKTFAVNLQNVISTVKAVGGTVGSTFFNAPSQSNPQPTTTNTPGPNPNPNQPPTAPATTGASGAGIADQITHSLDAIKHSLGPTGLLVGVGLIGLLIVTRGRK